MRYLVMVGSSAAALLWAQTGMAQPPAATPPTRQELFDQATKAWAEEDCAKALPLFETLGQDRGIKPGSLPAAIIDVERGECLISTDKPEEGELAILSGLPRLKQAGGDFTPNIASAEMKLAALAENRWDHDGALAHYQAALALLQGDNRSAALMRVAMLTSFDGGRTALDAVDEGLKLAQAHTPPDKSLLAKWYNMRGRILLNQGQIKPAMTALREALDLSGGLTDTVSLSDAVMRQDLAQASMLSHNQAEAYKFMGKSGAGRIEKSPFKRPIVMEPPACGPDTGLEPQDVAVVEFSITSEGLVGAAQPIYSTGSYAKAAAFARAVAQWQWRPDDVAQIPLFYRAATRVELHCTNATGYGGASPTTPLEERFNAWAGRQLQPYIALRGQTQNWQAWLAVAQDTAKGGDANGELAARTALANIDLRNTADALASIDRALALAAAPGGLPQDVRNSARILLTRARAEQEFAKNRFVNGLDAKERKIRAAMTALAADPAIAVDALAQDTALLLSVPDRYRSSTADQSMAILQRVAADTRLAEHHPVRQFAQLRLANQASQSGDLAEAQKWFDATGLTKAQCALIGPKPAVALIGGVYPDLARPWGFEGWARSEFDIQANGRTVEIRQLISYPPFIFSTAANETIAASRYQPSFRPERGVACSANTETMSFIVR